MKKIVSLLTACILLIPFVFVSCSDDDEEMPAIRVTSMAPGKNMITLIVGDSESASVSLIPEEASDKDLYNYEYTSGNENVFTVDDRGVVTAVGVGEAALRIDAVNNTDMWTTCVVKVEARVYLVTSIGIPAEFQDFYIGVDKTFDLGSKVTVNPDNATDPMIIYTSSDEMIASVNEYGEIMTHALGDVKITIKAIDGSGVTAECNLHIRNTIYVDLERATWTVTTSHPFAPDAAANGAPECLVDASTSTCLSLVKPGKSVAPTTVPASDIVYFIIDMKEQQQFDFFRLRHRTTNTSVNLRVTKVSVYGSNDNSEFVELISGATISVTLNEVTVDLPVVANYRYLKMTYDGWNNSGNTMQISDFNIGLLDFEK